MASVLARSELLLRLRTWAGKVATLARQLLLLASALAAAFGTQIEALLIDYPQLRTARNAVCHIGAFLIGSTYIDEHVAFTKPELVKDDVYRDRLLAPEIADLVDLCDALRLSLAQRKALFQCFRHLDFMRRAGVTRTELLRYCDLRSAKLSCFLLPECPDGATHRSGMTQRWDILQWFAVCFSLCTLEVDKLLQISIAEACQPLVSPPLSPVELHEPEQSDDPTPRHTAETAADQELLPSALPLQVAAAVPSLCDEIVQCFEFFVGVLSAHELHLQTLLCELYGDRLSPPATSCSSSTDGASGTTSADAQPRRLDFQQIHGVTTVLDVAKLFPVLVFPCIWIQRVLQRRILGANTWQVLQTRRRELQAVGMHATFLSFSDIIMAAQVHVHRKRRRPQRWVNVWLRLGWHSGSQAQLDEQTPLATSESPAASTPRKILPSIDATSESIGSATASPASAQAQDASGGTIECANRDEAWRVTANHVIASLCVSILHSQSEATSCVTGETACARFLEIAAQVASGTLAPALCEAVRKALVHAHGYQFTSFVFAKSGLQSVSTASKPRAEEKRAQQRRAKAWASLSVPEDKPSYWKQFHDPAHKRTFYYNIRTGESRWEKPTNVVSHSAAGKKKRGRKKQ